MTIWDDTDYAVVAGSYAAVRRPDPGIGAQILDALGGARTVLNVGAGAGSYEPEDRYVAAVEPSPEMRAHRPSRLAPAIVGTADALPFDDGAFDAAMAVLSVHHWPDLRAGLDEMRRVAPRRVILSGDPDSLDRLWLAAYSPEVHAVERRRYPSMERLSALLGGAVEVRTVLIPCTCTDGFADAFFGRPEAMLDERVRQAQSAWSFVSAADQDAFVQRLSADLESGAWDRRYGHLRDQESFEGSMRILIAEG
jgi:SAM-dependent methyltransferase